MSEEQKLTEKEWRRKDFEKRLASAINCYSRDVSSMTPDYIIAQLLADVVDAFDRAMKVRDSYYGNTGTVLTKD